jgi:hypothetical protein
MYGADSMGGSGTDGQKSSPSVVSIFSAYGATLPQVTMGDTIAVSSSLEDRMFGGGSNAPTSSAPHVNVQSQNSAEDLSSGDVSDEHAGGMHTMRRTSKPTAVRAAKPDEAEQRDALEHQLFGHAPAVAYEDVPDDIGEETLCDDMVDRIFGTAMIASLPEAAKAPKIIGCGRASDNHDTSDRRTDMQDLAGSRQVMEARIFAQPSKVSHAVDTRPFPADSGVRQAALGLNVFRNPKAPPDMDDVQGCTSLEESRRSLEDRMFGANLGVTVNTVQVKVLGALVEQGGGSASPATAKGGLLATTGSRSAPIGVGIAEQAGDSSTSKRTDSNPLYVDQYVPTAVERQ